MPSSTTSTNRFGREIVFEENTHKYYIDDPNKRIDFTSVTTFIGNYFPKFDAEKIAPFTAKKRGISVQEVLDEWEKTRNDACEFGTRVHACCEDTLLNRELRYAPSSPKEELVFPNAIKAANDIKEKYDIVGVEKLVFDEPLRLSGTIDCLVKSKENEFEYCIVDWKTNKKIDDKAKYGKHAFAPIAELPDCEMSHYGLQLTLYGHILKSGGYIPMNAKLKYLLVHITEGSATYIPVMNYEKYVQNLLNVRYNYIKDLQMEEYIKSQEGKQ